MCAVPSRRRTDCFRALRDALRSSRRRSRRRVASTATFGSAATEDLGTRTRSQWGTEIREVYASVADLSESMREALVAVDVLGFMHSGPGGRWASARRVLRRGC